MRPLQQREVAQVAGAGVEVGVNVPANKVDVTLTALFGLVKIPVVKIDWSKFMRG